MYRNMMKLQTKLVLYNLLSKLFLSGLFLAFLPYIVERINILQTDNELIKKREEVLDLISEIGIEPFITPDTMNDFGSYNILKEEFISLERIDLAEDWNFIEVTQRLIEDETIDYRVLNYSFKLNEDTYLLEIGKSLASIDYAEKNIKKIIVAFLVLLILITLFADLFFTSRILHPLKLIIAKLNATSTPSLFNRTPVVTTTSDFHQLDQTIRDLMIKIDELFQKEKEITVNISHELMTPLSVLRSKLENLMLQENLSDDTAVKVEESLRTLHRLKTLVNSLLMIARIESQQYLKEDSVKIAELLKEVKAEIIPVAVDSGVTINEKFKEDFLFAGANRSLIFSMIYNVINNSLKNTPPGGHIDIITTRKNGKFVISISDTGKGMTQEQIDKLFSRLRMKLHPEKESTGIGLAITKSIADFHKINISVSSSPGKGTAFSFIFP